MPEDRRQFLARYYDAALDPPKVKDSAELERAEIERLSRALSVVVIAGSIPRRLGGDATDEDLALDTKRARRVGHALNGAIKGWTKKSPPLPVSDEIRREGAQIDWDVWRETHLTTINNQLRCLATWAIQNQQESWGKSAVVRLENEINWVTYALRD